MPLLGQYSDQPTERSTANQFGSRVSIQLATNALSMIADGPCAQLQYCRNFFGGFSFSD
jgi:hypothetical protein